MADKLVITYAKDGTVESTRVIGQTSPSVISKTAFQDLAVSKLGGGVTGMARFMAVMDATKGSASDVVRFAYARYEAASTFEKTKVGQLTMLMASDSTVGHLTTDERTLILDNWPTE
jgi:hypothetical protein